MATGTVLQVSLGHGDWDGLTVLAIAGDPGLTVFARGDLTETLSVGDRIEYHSTDVPGAAAYDGKLSRVEYVPHSDSSDIEVLIDGRVSAGMEPGDLDHNGTYVSSLPGVTISYGSGFMNSRHFADEAAAKRWIERHADDLHEDEAE